MEKNFLLANYGIVAEINTTPFEDTETWAVFGAGFTDVSEALNEVVQDYQFFSGKGYGVEYVTGMAPKHTASGVRIVGDAAQDFIFNAGTRYGLMAERNTQYRFSLPNADGTVEQIIVPVTLSNIQAFGGASTDGASITVDIAFNGKPQIQTITPSASLTVTSKAGTTTGTITITVAPTFPAAGCKYVYNIGGTAATVGKVVTGWNDLTNGGTYTGSSTATVNVAEVNTATMTAIAVGSSK